MIPKKIKYMSYVYDVIETDAASFTANYDGYVRHDPPVITLSKSTGHINGVLLHEIVHIVDKYMDTGLTEHQVTVIAEGLNHALRENFKPLEPI